MNDSGALAQERKSNILPLSACGEHECWGSGMRGVVGVLGDEWRAPGGRSMKDKPGK